MHVLLYSTRGPDQRCLDLAQILHRLTGLGREAICEAERLYDEQYSASRPLILVVRNPEIIAALEDHCRRTGIHVEVVGIAPSC